MQQGLFLFQSDGYKHSRHFEKMKKRKCRHTAVEAVCSLDPASTGALNASCLIASRVSPVCPTHVTHLRSFVFQRISSLIPGCHICVSFLNVFVVVVVFNKKSSILGIFEGNVWF